jgi:hypothetical protein
MTLILGLREAMAACMTVMMVIVEDDNLASPMYVEYLIHTDLSSTTKPASTHQPSPSAPPSSPSAVAGTTASTEPPSSTPTPPTPTTQLATPPVTPPKSTQKSPRTKKPAKPTPTRVGKLIHQFGKVSFTPDEVTLLGDAMAGEDGVEIESLAKDYKDFVASDARDISNEEAVKHVKRMIHAADCLPRTTNRRDGAPLCSLTRVRSSLQSQLINNREIQQVTAAYGRTLQTFVEDFGAAHDGSLIHVHSPGILLGYRFLLPSIVRPQLRRQII